jgi:hypothetical protein
MLKELRSGVMKRLGKIAFTARPGRLLKVGALLPAFAMVVGLASLTGMQSAHAYEDLGPEPTSMSPGTVCVGSVVTFYGHEFYGNMTAHFGSATTAAYNIQIPIGDNDTAQATVPVIAAGTYTVSLSDTYGTGIVPTTLTVQQCVITGGGNWNLANTKAVLVAFHPPIRFTGQTKPALGTSSFALTDPYDMGVIDKSAKATLSMALGSNACTALFDPPGTTPVTTTLNITWTPDSIAPSTVTFSGITMSEDSSGAISLNLGGQGTSVTGSYASSDSGASSTMTLPLVTTLGQLETGCETKGQPSVTVSGGSLSLQ